MKPEKCKKVGCYEPQDCAHGYCRRHCTYDHEIKPYTDRRLPRSQALHIGLEIEVYFGTEAQRSRALAFGEGHYDSSLPECSAEFKVLAPSTKIVEVSSNLLHGLWQRGARVNRDCGLHVHIDARKLATNYFHRRAFMTWMMQTEAHWFMLVPPSRRDNNCNCQRIDYVDTTSHHVWCHWTDYGTYEIRIHSATLNHLKLEGWLTAMLWLQEKLHDESFRWPVYKIDPEEVATGISRVKLTAKEAFWAVFDEAPRKAKEYLVTREKLNGVLTDYAFQAREEV